MSIGFEDDQLDALDEDSIEGLQEDAAAVGVFDDPEGDYELPGAVLDGPSPVFLVMPLQADEFTCQGCFLVHHRSGMRPGGRCIDCE